MRRGALSRKEKKQINKLKEIINTYANDSFSKNLTFKSAVSIIVATKEYDHDRMMSKLRMTAGKMKQSTCLVDYINLFSDIYNYKARSVLNFSRSRAS